MASDSISFLSSARNKLQSLVGNNVKDSSLHRWVLLKNSYLRSHLPPVAVPVADKVEDDSVYRSDEEPEHEEHDAFMFPDPDALHQDIGAGNSEDQWLDSVLEDLGDEDEDDADNNSTLSLPPTHEDDEPLSPLYSPMSSSDDLVDQSTFYYASDIAIPYPIPYPPLHPPLVPTWLNLETPSSSVLESCPPLYHDPLPYFDTDELEDLPVPDAIEDTSDDESDSLRTPYSNSTSSLSPTHSTTPLPHEPTQARSHPQVYIDSEDSYFYPFELDPLPFPDNNSSDTSRAFHGPHHYSEC